MREGGEAGGGGGVGEVRGGTWHALHQRVPPPLPLSPALGALRSPPTILTPTNPVPQHPADPRRRGQGRRCRTGPRAGWHVRLPPGRRGRNLCLGRPRAAAGGEVHVRGGYVQFRGGHVGGRDACAPWCARGEGGAEGREERDRRGRARPDCPPTHTLPPPNLQPAARCGTSYRASCPTRRPPSCGAAWRPTPGPGRRPGKRTTCWRLAVRRFRSRGHPGGAAARGEPAWRRRRQRRATARSATWMRAGLGPVPAPAPRRPGPRPARASRLATPPATPAPRRHPTQRACPPTRARPQWMHLVRPPLRRQRGTRPGGKRPATWCVPCGGARPPWPRPGGRRPAQWCPAAATVTAPLMAWHACEPCEPACAPVLACPWHPFLPASLYFGGAPPPPPPLVIAVIQIVPSPKWNVQKEKGQGWG